MTDQLNGAGPTDNEAPASPAGDEVDVTANQEANNEGGDDESLLDPEGTQKTAEEILEEWEHNGKKYKVHPDLRPHLMMQSDYTRKTQEVAEARRALEGHQEMLKQQAEAQQKYTESMASIANANFQLKTLDARIAQYEKVNWDQLEQTNPVHAQKLQRQLSADKHLREQWKEHHASHITHIAGLEQRRLMIQQYERTKLMNDGEQFLRREIKGWSPSHAAKLVAFAQERGVPQQTVLKLQDDPWAVLLLNEAMVGRELLKKQRAAARQSDAPAPAPTTRVGSGRPGPATHLDDRVNINDWVAAREKQLAARMRRR